MFRPRLVLLALLLTALTASAQAVTPVVPTSDTPPAHHALVRIHLDSDLAADWLHRNGAGLDVLSVKPGVAAEVAAQPDDLAMLRAAGLRLDILEPDMESAKANPEKAVGFGDYHTYAENTAFVDSLRLLYPEVVSEKWSIGQSHLGNDLWCFRISDNPDIDESEPEVLIDAMHHAREIMSSEFAILFAEYLASNYGTDPEVTWLVDNRELYIVPIVNPDGVLYNESTNPGGGGMWRKNWRDNDDGTFGVDPNRNYPWEWGYDDSGSSPTPSDITYRGPSAGSEPEVQAIMNLIASRAFVTHNTIHTYSNLTLYPWGYENLQTPDGSKFAAMGAEMCKYNGYVYGTPVEAINYAVNGGTIDWTYGQHGMFSFSNEIGNSNDGFWPTEERRIPLFLENIWPHRYLMRAAGPFVTVHSADVQPLAKAIGPGQSGRLDFTVENQGADDAAPATNLTITSRDAWLQLDEAERSVVGLAPLTGVNLGSAAIPFSVETGCPEGHFAVVDVTSHMPEGDLDFPLTFLVGTPAPVFFDDMESGDGNWTLTGNWSLSTEEAYSGSYGLTDSPNAPYGDNETYSATLTGEYLATRLTYRQKYSIEEGWDYGRVQISVDGGAWQTIHSATGVQDTWEEVELDLDSYLGSMISFRFLLETDTSVTDNGWWIDDVSVEGFTRDNLAPTVPDVAILTGVPSGDGTAIVALINTTDPEGDALTYGFRVYADELCTQPLLTELDVPEGSGVTEFWISGLEDGSYWWRGWAFDGIERSWMTEPTPVTIQSGSPAEMPITLSAGLRVLDGVTGGQARLRLDLPRAETVTLDIYDARGARVRRLHAGSLESGTRTLVWDGRSSSGRQVSSGLYLVRMVYGGEVFTGRVVMVR